MEGDSCCTVPPDPGSEPQCDWQKLAPPTNCATASSNHLAQQLRPFWGLEEPWVLPLQLPDNEIEERGAGTERVRPAAIGN